MRTSRETRRRAAWIQSQGFQRGYLAPIQNSYCAFRSHNRDLSRGISEVDVSADMLAGHHAISSAISLACYQGDLRHSRLGKCKQQLRAVTDDPAVLLLN